MGFLCSGDKLSLGPDHDPRCTKWTKVLGNSVETTFLEDTEDIELSPGPDNDPIPQVHEWTKVERNCIEPAILEEFLCRDHKAKLHRYTEWTRVVRNGIETTILEGFLCRGAQN